MCSEVKEQGLCLAAAALEAPCSAPHGGSQMPQVALQITCHFLKQSSGTRGHTENRSVPTMRTCVTPALFSLPDVETSVLIWESFFFYHCPR